MSSSSNTQTKSQSNFWQNKQFQKFEINYQNKSQNVYFENYNTRDENDLWTFENDQDYDDQSIYYDDEEYYDDRSIEKTLKTSIKSENAQSSEFDQKISEKHFENILSEKLNQMTKTSQITLKCCVFNKKFYFNDKLHRHVRLKQHESISKIESVSKQIENSSIMISTRDQKNHKKFVLRNHQYARVKENFRLRDKFHEFCVDFKTFMSLINRKFLKKHCFETTVEEIKSKLEVWDIDSKTHDTFSYCSLDFYFREHVNDKSKITHIRKKFHLVNDLQINILIEMNIISSKKCILNFKTTNMMFSFCDNIEILITIVSIEQSVKRSILATKKTIVFFHIDMIVFIKIREKSLSTRDYIFNSIEEILLDLEDELFSHIMTNNSVKMQIKNISNQAYVIFKNYKIEKMNDYHENDSHAISLKNRHLIIASNKLFVDRQKMNSREFQSRNVSEKDKFLETILFNDIIVHDNKESIARIVAMINDYLNV
jgi:hypothetical protein